MTEANIKRDETSQFNFWPYLAGFIDGEACFNITKRKKSKESTTCYVVYNISISSTTLDVLNYIQLMTGCGQIVGAGKPKKSSHKKVYQWRVCGKHLQSILMNIIPFLKVKKRHAFLFLELAKHTTPNGRNNEEGLKIKMKIFDDIRYLNKTGPGNEIPLCKVGDVFQIDPDHDKVFGGSYLIVTEPKAWGAQGYIEVPDKDGTRPAYYRCNFQNMEFCGVGSWIRDRGDDDK